MFISILLLPLISIFLLLFLSNYLGRLGSITFILFNMFFLLIVSFFLLVDVYSSNSVISYYLSDWLELGFLNVKWFFLFDGLSSLMLIVVLGISFCVHIYSLSYMNNDPYIVRFLTYLFLFTFCMLILVSSGNLLILFIGWEGVGICSYLLINFWYTRIDANTSALKAMYLNRIGDYGLLLAIIVLINISSSVEFSHLYSISFMFLEIENINSFLSLSLVLLLVGVVGKSAQIGLHMWLPDAMEGPTPVSSLIHAATMVTAGVFVLLRCSFLFELLPDFLLVLLLLGSITSFLAATIGMCQKDLKKIIAYSTCSQLGYMVFTCGLSKYNIAFFHLFNHAFFKALLFMGAGIIIHALFEEQDLRRMGDFFYRLPFTYTLFVIATLSLLGFPFLSGYYSKDLLLEYAFINYDLFGYYSFFFGNLVAGITSFYSFKLIFFVFFSSNYSRAKRYSFRKEFLDLDIYIFYSILFLLFGSIFFGYFFSDLVVGSGSFFFSNSYLHISSDGYFFDYFFIPLFIKWLPFLLSVAGCFIVFYLYNDYFKKYVIFIYKGKLFSRSFQKANFFLAKGWFFNEIVNLFSTSLFFKSYYIFYISIEKGMVELLGSKGLITFFSSVYNSLLFLLNQKFYHYVMLILFIIVVFNMVNFLFYFGLLVDVFLVDYLIYFLFFNLSFKYV